MLSSQQTIANRYVLKERLGAGSYAETWLAIDLTLNRDVAVKVLYSEHADSQEDLNRFRHEVRTAASVSHPNVVAAYDASAGDDLAFLVMEWVDGVTLKDEIRSQRRADQQRTISVIDGLLGGLSQIHAAGIIHRDIKPQNVLVTRSGEVKISDFGASISRDCPDQNATETTVGSAAYMAPEQARGVIVTPAADIYAVGVIMYEMLTGRLPFSGSDPHAVIHKHLVEPVTRPKRLNPNIPSSLEAIIQRALAKDPSDRYQTAEEMRAELLGASIAISQRRSGLFAARSDTSRAPRYALIAASIALMFIMIAGSTAIAIRDFSVEAPLTDDTEVPGNEGEESAQPPPLAREKPVGGAGEFPPASEPSPVPIEPAPLVEEEDDSLDIARSEDEAFSDARDDADDNADVESESADVWQEIVVTRSQGINISRDLSDDEIDSGAAGDDQDVDPSTSSSEGDELAEDTDAVPDAQTEDDEMTESQDSTGDSSNDESNGEIGSIGVETSESPVSAMEAALSEAMELATESITLEILDIATGVPGNEPPSIPPFTLPEQVPAGSAGQGFPVLPPSP